MAYSLQEISDFEDIRTLKHRYFRAIDTVNRPLLETLFTEDVKVDYRGGDYRAKFEGRDNMLDFLIQSFTSDVIAMHQGHTPEITLTGPDTAEGLWYLEDINIYVDGKSQTLGTAIYHDHYRREDGVWKIASTEFERVFSVSFTYETAPRIFAHYLAKVGVKPHERHDITHLVAPVPVE